MFFFYMKIIYFDCFSGISGDMIIGALIDVGLDFSFLRKELEKLSLEGYRIESKRVVKNGITGIKFNVIENHKPSDKERNLNEINKIIDNSKLDNDIKNTIKKIFLKIATAEAKIHGKSVNQIHFHELGAIDTIIDVAGAVIGIKKLGIKKAYCSKLNVGTGFVDMSHGKFPVPAPATAEILKGFPIYHNNVEAELVTPTGAAIITTLAEKFGEMPLMEIEKVGYGSGTYDLKQPNVLRVMLSNIIEKKEDNPVNTIDVIEANIDNMSAELFPYSVDKLMENGALDVYLTNILMKKGRPAVKLTVLADPKDTEMLSKIIFDETTTLGLRISRSERKILDREIKVIKTKYGNVRMKISKLGNEIKNITPEYEDCVKIAKSNKLPLKKVYRGVS